MRDLATWPAAHAALSAEEVRAVANRVRPHVDAYLASDGTPPEAYYVALEPLLVPLCGWLNVQREPDVGPTIAGIAGAQGTGKTTIAEVIRSILTIGFGANCVRLSLDDLYLTRAERDRLAREIHPLLRTRGVPGTHDVALGRDVLDQLRAADSNTQIRVPRFDKAADDRAPEGAWSSASVPIDVVLFEGWCVGAEPEPAAALAQPVNALERDADADGRWRSYVNAQLAGPYRRLFELIDVSLFIAAPDLASSRTWRIAQEHQLRARSTAAQRLMSDAEVERFVQFYERISQRMLADAPDRADVVLSLARDHTFAGVRVNTRG